MNDVITEQNVIKGWDGGVREDLFADVVKLCAKFNKSEDHKDLIHVRQIGIGYALGRTDKSSFFSANICPKKEDNSIPNYSKLSMEEITQ